MDVKTGFRVSGNGLSNEILDGDKPSRFSLVDTVGLCSSVVLFVTGALLLANGTCSVPRGLSADNPVCAGGQLSVQTWLAIIGVEFSLAGSVLLPRLWSAAISQFVTSVLVKEGAPLDRVLNSLSTAPFLTQMRKGWRKVMLARLTGTLLVLAVTVMYKFSFVVVNRHDTLPARADWAGMASTAWVPGEPCPMYSPWAGDKSVFNNNYQDLVAGANNSILYVGSWAANATSGPATLYMGPSINVTSVPQLRNGTVSLCVPATFTKFAISAAPASSSWSEASAPFVHGRRVGQGFGTAPAAYISVVGAPDGSLGILPVNNSTFKPGADPEYGLNYEFVVAVKVQDCWGNFTWNNAGGYQIFSMQEPVDTFCTNRNMSGFAPEGIFVPYIDYAQAVTAAYFTRRSAYASVDSTLDWDPKRAIELFLLSLPSDHDPPLPAPGSMAVSNPALRAVCDANALPVYNADLPCPWVPSPLVVLSGLIESHGTGMTALGLALQGFVVMLALAAAAMFLLPGVALLSEWPAQWLALARELSPREVAAAVVRTSRGMGYVEDSLGSNVVLVVVPEGRGVVAKLLAAPVAPGASPGTARAA